MKNNADIKFQVIGMNRVHESGVTLVRIHPSYSAYMLLVPGRSPERIEGTVHEALKVARQAVIDIFRCWCGGCSTADTSK